MQIGRYFDQSRCIGCYACIAACRSWNKLTPDQPDLLRLVSIEEDDFPNVSLRYMITTCFHCASPSCMAACPPKIITKQEPYGQITIDTAKCTSCRKCQKACPYKAPIFGANKKSPAMLCTLCSDRLDKGEKPACVIACPVEAMDIGPLDELVNKYGSNQHIKDLPASPTVPGVVFKSKK